MQIGTLKIKNKPAIVASIGSNKPIETALLAKKLGADLLEIRIDLLQKDTANEIRGIFGSIKNAGKLPIIATNRRKEEGGSWKGKEKDRIELLLSVLNLADAIDIELKAESKDSVIKEVKSANKTIIVSFHDFSNTP
ncbi:MAG TPA: type I 3-dehydroquinate dehydratase, partial [Methanosarcinales archaeon]|nr:type I 3-dehydroquinate dehydratase [Methanosarcinales archaeon]